VTPVEVADTKLAAVERAAKPLKELRDALVRLGDDYDHDMLEFAIAAADALDDLEVQLSRLAEEPLAVVAAEEEEAERAEAAAYRASR
jgi:hypothetical protein